MSSKSRDSFFSKKPLLSKILIIGTLILVLFIPIQMVSSLVTERFNRRNDMIIQMANVWGKPQVLKGMSIVNNVSWRNPIHFQNQQATEVFQPHQDRIRVE